ncbi:uncharacterized protein isoform X1 [Rhodnius prolixus]|uniref:uncharacterized protein isoform X1 n=1 Tax=Rhodnius prolixus TaxID=13249 RepID=UPI003D18B02E
MNVGIGPFEKKSLFQSNVCRLCSSIRDKLLPIFDNSGSKVDIKIKECLPSLDVRQEDCKPQQICLECITKLNMYNEFLQLCLQSESKFEACLRNYRSEEENNLKKKFINEDETDNCMWESEANKIPEQSMGLQSNADVIVLSKLDSTLTDPSAQDFVVMVELKYKDNIPPASADNLLEYVPEKTALPVVDSPDIPNFDSLLDLDAIKENTSKLYDNTLVELLNKQNKTVKDEKNVEVNSKELSEKINKDKKSYECGVCGRKFKRRTRLNSHMARHTEIRPFNCRQCEKSFVMKWELNLHERVHSRTYACHLCSKVFGSKSKLSRHGRVHSGERPYPCLECGKAFGEKRNLDNHARTHSGARPYSCQLCGKSFNVRSHMVDHLNVHKRTPRFQCSSCAKSFKWKTNYNRHIRIHKLSESIESFTVL